jgi:hypothetical protein
MTTRRINKYEKKQIVKLLNSFGLTRSKTSNKLYEISFKKIERVHKIEKAGYKFANDGYTLWLDLDCDAQTRVEIAQQIANELIQIGFVVANYDDALTIEAKK